MTTDAPTTPDLSTSEPAASGFSTFGLRPELVQAVAGLGYTAPTDIQTALIPVMLAGRDVMGQAQTGTGKTAAFALPTLHALVPGQSHVQALVLAPTRELAVQVAAALEAYGRTLGARVLAVYGGTPYGPQVTRLRRGVDVVVGTPGRLLDLLNQNALDLSHVRTVVLDEADEMLSMGFSEDLEAILDRTPAERQTAVLSATLPPGIRRLADKYLREPEAVTVAGAQKTVGAIEQRAYLVRHGDKVNALARLLEIEPVVSAVVFAQTRAGTTEIAAALAERGFAAEALSGDLSQGQRDEVLDRFRRQRSQILVATDVAARGLDIDHVSHVVNVDLPRDPEVYVHRIGRTGRAGKSGVALSLVAPYHRNELRRIEGYVRQPIPVAALPTPDDIRRHRDALAQARLTARLERTPSDRDRALVAALVAGGADPMDVAAAALGLARADEDGRSIAPIEEMRPQFRDTRRPAQPEFRGDRRDDRQGPDRQGPDRPGSDRPGSDRPGRERQGADRSGHKMVALTLDTGRADGIQPGQVVGALAYFADIPGYVIGKIRIGERQTEVDVPEHLVEEILSRRGTYMIGRQKIAVERA